jgi:hypothetical protein
MPPRKTTSLSRDVIAQYMIAELDSLTQRALQHENMLTTKINFFLVLVTASGGGLFLSASITALENLLLPVSSLLTLLLFILGWVTFTQGLDLSANSIVMYRRMGRIRQWFLDAEPELKPYLPFNPGDNRPQYYVSYAPVRGIETILLLVNSSTAAASIALLWLFLSFQVFHIPFSMTGYPYLIALTLAIPTLWIVWKIQVNHLRNFMVKQETQQFEKGYVHFPAVPNPMK